MVSSFLACIWGSYVDTLPPWNRKVPSASYWPALEYIREEDTCAAANNISHCDPAHFAEGLFAAQLVEIEGEDGRLGHHEGWIVKGRECVCQFPRRCVPFGGYIPVVPAEAIFSR